MKDQQFSERYELRIDRISRTVTKDGRKISLVGRQFDAVLVLTQTPGQPVDKETLLKRIWPEVIVGEDSVRKIMQCLRTALGQDAIENRRNQGYLLALPFSFVDANPPRCIDAEDRPQEPSESPRREGLLPASAADANSKFRFWPLICLIVASVLFSILVIVGSRHIQSAAVASSPQIGRLLAQSTAEGHKPRRIPLGSDANYTVLSPKGDKLFVTTTHSRSLFVVNTQNQAVHTIQLPQMAGPLVASSNGLLYVGSEIDGIMLVEIEKERVHPDVIQTGGPVRDLVITPDGEKLFLAMSHFGLKRLLTRTGQLDQLSDRNGPEYLSLDREGKNLFVAYQNSGPGGQAKHDSVEIFDTSREASLRVISGPVMIGGPNAVSADGKIFLQDGWDACVKPMEGCKQTPTRVMHLFRSFDGLLVRTLYFPPLARVNQFLGSSRFVISGPSVYVVDAARYTQLEKWDVADDTWGPVVLAPSGRFAYFTGQLSKSIMAIELDPPDCGPPQHGLSLFYAGDGTAADAVMGADLSAHGKLLFRAGRVGQAFYFDGSNSLHASTTGTYALGSQDISIAFYLKPMDTGREMALIDRVTDVPKSGIRLIISATNQLVFQSWPGDGVVVSKKALKPNDWNHVSVTKSNREVAMYINGELQGQGVPIAPFEQPHDVPLLFGANQVGSPLFRGLLDEIAFYNRALTPEEIKTMYQQRETGKCKI